MKKYLKVLVKDVGRVAAFLGVMVPVAYLIVLWLEYFERKTGLQPSEAFFVTVLFVVILFFFGLGLYDWHQSIKERSSHE